MNLNDVTRIVGRRTTLKYVMIGLSVLSLGLASCSSSAPTSSSPGAPPPTSNLSSTEPPTTPNASSSTPSGLNGPGLLVAHCQAPSATLELLNPSNGSVLASEAVGPAAAATQVSFNDACHPDQSGKGFTDGDLTNYSPDLAFMLATEQTSDGLLHAGWVDRMSGSFTDVSAALHSSEFTAAQSDYAPAGWDRAGDFFFYSGKEGSPTGWFEIASGTNTAAKLGAPPPEATYSFSPDHRTRVTSFEAVSASTGVTSGLVSNLPADIQQPPKWYLPHTDAEVVLSTPVTNGGITSMYVQCNYRSWVTDTLLLCSYGNGEPEYVTFPGKPVPSGSGGYWLAVASPRPVLPPNERANTGFIPSPDGKTVDFLSIQGQIITLYEVGTAPGSIPVKVADLPAGQYQPLRWR